MQSPPSTYHLCAQCDGLFRGKESELPGGWARQNETQLVKSLCDCGHPRMRKLHNGVQPRKRLFYFSLIAAVKRAFGNVEWARARHDRPATGADMPWIKTKWARAAKDELLGAGAAAAQRAAFWRRFNVVVILIGGDAYQPYDRRNYCYTVIAGRCARANTLHRRGLRALQRLTSVKRCSCG